MSGQINWLQDRPGDYQSKCHYPQYPPFKILHDPQG